MSYDMTLPNGEDYNLTYNLFAMLSKAFDKADWKDVQHLSTKDLQQETANAIVRMQTYRVDFEKLNPSNGWGSYEGCLKFLNHLYVSCDSEDGGDFMIM